MFQSRTMKKLLHRNHFLLLLFSTFLSFSIASDALAPGQTLTDGQILISAGGSFALGFFTPPGSKNRYVGIWYNTISLQTVVWVANRQNPITSLSGSLVIASNGSLIVTDNSTVFWSSPVVTISSPIAQLLDNGNFVIRDQYSTDTESFGWQSFDYPTNALLPGMKLGWDLTRALNRNLTSWRTPSDPSPGAYTLAMDIQGVPQTIVWSGGKQYWRAGPWDGLRFAGMPEMNTINEFNFTVVDNQQEIYYMFHILNNSIISRLLMNYDGMTQRVTWLNQSKLWSVFWGNPKDPCDRVSACGPYGLCNANDSPICSCLQGFTPKLPENWALRDGTDGCVRRTPLDCNNGTDGFMTVGGAKLPDTSNATVNMSMNLEECRASCLTNCSCTAYASANVVGSGNGCIMWSGELTDLRLYPFNGQNLYVRLAAADLGSSSGHPQSSAEAIVAVTVSCTLGLLLTFWIGHCIWTNKKRRRAVLDAISFRSYYEDESVGGKELDLPTLDWDIIISATNEFCWKNKLGEGGFGPVFKGTLGGQDIAVKRLSRTSVQGQDEFMNEVRLIAKLQHRNLVRLLGCSIQGAERMLIYEYMPNNSLDAFLFDKAKGTSLDWDTRYQIIVGIARGLVYLHHDSRFRIIHRDLKASNVLLDKEMNPKISDFGLARMFGGDETEANTRKVVGTYGYMSPEYAMDGKFSMKSDVFSFGVLLLEIISGKRNRGVYLSEPHLNLIGQAWNLWKEGRDLELIDDLLGHSFSATEALGCIKIGLLCVQESPEDRPTMSKVVLMLGSDNATLPHPKKPGFVASKGVFETDTTSSKQDSCSVNGITITIIDGR